MPGAQTVRIPASRVYRMRPWQHIIGIVFLVFGLAFGIAVWSQVLTGQKEAIFLEMMVPVLFTAVAVLILHRASQNYVQVSESAVVLRTLSAHRILPIHLIRGRRIYIDPGDGESPDIRHLVLESDDDRYQTLDIEDLYSFGEPFRTWFHSLRDLDEADKSGPKTSNFGLV